MACIVLYIIIICISLAALVFAFFRAKGLIRHDPGNERMQQIAAFISKGALSFLKMEYKVLSVFVILLAIAIALSADPETSHAVIGFAFIIGASLSALAGLIGMRIATKANVRTTQAARTSLAKTFHISFAGGSVMGISVAALGILGLTILFAALQWCYNPNGTQLHRVLEILTGFSLGAESIALFARVAGGIFTKAADVGADLVGKVEAGIPEDDPRNPAVIADNVGDNVGDVAGMGADLFGSFVSTILATMVLGATATVLDEWNGLSLCNFANIHRSGGLNFFHYRYFFCKDIGFWQSPKSPECW